MQVLLGSSKILGYNQSMRKTDRDPFAYGAGVSSEKTHNR